MILKGKRYNSSDKQEQKPCIMQAKWLTDIYGIPPTSLPEAYQSDSNYRPVKIHYLNNYTLHSQPFSSYFACVSWPKPDPHRYKLGIPVKLGVTTCMKHLGYTYLYQLIRFYVVVLMVS